jgi:hypothetical protein
VNLGVNLTKLVKSRAAGSRFPDAATAAQYLKKSGGNCDFSFSRILRATPGRFRILPPNPWKRDGENGKRFGDGEFACTAAGMSLYPSPPRFPGSPS